MDFDFMEVIFFFVWIFFLFKAVFGGRRKNIPSPEESLPPDPGPVEKVPSPVETTEEGQSQTSYDYAKLRKRILTSWEESQEEKKDTPVISEEKTTNEKEKPLSSKPVSVTIKKTMKPVLKKVSVSPAILQDEKNLKPQVHREHHHKVEGAVAFSAVHLEVPKVQKEWTAADARKWLVYDAIFGTPRAKVPWRPR